MALNEYSEEIHRPFRFFISKKIIVPQGVSKIVKIDPPVANFPKDGFNVTPGGKVWWIYESDQAGDIRFFCDDNMICCFHVPEYGYGKIFVHFQ